MKKNLKKVELPELHLCIGREELADTIAAYVDGARHKGAIGDIDFKVEDVPTKEEWDGMGLMEKASAWNDALGGYGIKEVGKLFDDSDSFMLVANYWGGSNMVPSAVFDRDNGETEIYKIVEDLVDSQLSFEDHSEGRYLLRITEIKYI